MMNFISQNKKIFLAVLFVGIAAHSQNLIPATSEDQEEFDRQLEAMEQSASAKPLSDAASKVQSAKSKSAQFQQSVKEEAKKLKDADLATRQQLGKKIAEQRRQNETRSGGPGVGGSSSGADGQSSSPKFNNAGGNPNAPGQSGNRKK